MTLDCIPDELKDLNKIEKVLLFKITLFKEMRVMHGKGEFSKMKEIIRNVPIEAANIVIFYQGQQSPMD